MFPFLEALPSCRAHTEVRPSFQVGSPPRHTRAGSMRRLKHRLLVRVHPSFLPGTRRAGGGRITPRLDSPSTARHQDGPKCRRCPRKSAE